MNNQEEIKILKYYESQPYFFSGDASAAAAFRLAILALEKQSARQIIAEQGICERCPECESGEWLRNEDNNANEYCGQCGIKLDWSVGE